LRADAGWVRIGHHTTASDIVQGVELGECCRPEELWLAIGGKGRRRGPGGEGQDKGPLELFSRGASWSHANPWPAAPPLDVRASQAGCSAQRTRGPKERGAQTSQSGLSSISGYGAQQHNGRMAAWDNLNNGRGCRRPSSPSWAPRQRQQVLVHAFCRTVCMAIATLAAVNQFVFAYLHIRLKLSRTSRLQESFFELFRDGGPALAAPDRKLDGFKSRVSLPLLAGCLPCWFGSRPPLDE
jgi:hypothetical protein